MHTVDGLPHQVASNRQGAPLELGHELDQLWIDMRRHQVAADAFGERFSTLLGLLCGITPLKERHLHVVGDN